MTPKELLALSVPDGWSLKMPRARHPDGLDVRFTRAETGRCYGTVLCVCPDCFEKVDWPATVAALVAGLPWSRDFVVWRTAFSDSIHFPR